MTIDVHPVVQGWVVTGARAPFSSLREAVQVGLRMLEEHGGGDLLVYELDGLPRYSFRVPVPTEGTRPA